MRWRVAEILDGTTGASAVVLELGVSRRDRDIAKVHFGKRIQCPAQPGLIDSRCFTPVFATGSCCVDRPPCP